jgi:hypothetical protein
MNPFTLLRDGFRITFRARPLWVLALLLCVALTPALLLAGGLGAVLSYGMMPARADMPVTFDLPFRNFSTLEWLLFLGVTLCLLTITSLLSWAVQAAMIRAADAAAEGKPISVLGALHLGRRRWGSLLKLALTFGLVIQALGILPALLSVFLRENTAWGSAVVPLVQTFLSPFNLILGILVFLLMMSIALEDVRPKAAFRRIGTLVRSGWWGFLIAYALQGALALAAAFIFAFLLTIVGFLILAAWWTGSPAGTVLAVAICILASPVGLALLTFILVFSTVFFTLTYRTAAAGATEKEVHPTGEDNRILQ